MRTQGIVGIAVAGRTTNDPFFVPGFDAIQQAHLVPVRNAAFDPGAV